MLLTLLSLLHTWTFSHSRPLIITLNRCSYSNYATTHSCSSILELEYFHGHLGDRPLCSDKSPLDEAPEIVFKRLARRSRVRYVGRSG